VGAARFLRGLRSLLDPARLTIIVNTADDETFFGLHVSPDIDTVTYTLADRVDPKQGWGVAHDSFTCLAALQRFYPETWFRLGDGDLATHIYRTDELRRGHSLTRVTAAIAARLGVRYRVLPMSDQPVRTHVEVAGRGSLPFQDYLVKGRGQGRVRRVRFAGIGAARPAPGVLTALRGADAVILPPSNPIVSIHPILGLRGVRQTLRRTRAQVAAVSPLVRGLPIKGPLDHMLRGLGHEVSAVGVAELYRDFVDLFLDDRDADLAPRVEALGMRTLVTDTIMRTPTQSRRLAQAVLTALQSGRAGKTGTTRLTQQRLHAWGGRRSVGAAFENALELVADTAPTERRPPQAKTVVKVLFRPGQLRRAGRLHGRGAPGYPRAA
jgi:LPPG:FO 2-phospho-L-lactate transferase